MIILSQEENCKISAHQRYDIINFALEAANESGFVNQFIFERALYLYAALILLETIDKDDFREKLIVNPLSTWDLCVKDGTLNALVKLYKDDLEYLAESAAQVMEDYAAYQISIKGALDNLQLIGGQIGSFLKKEVKTIQEETDLQTAIDIAKEWGMDNGENKIDTQFSSESLFS